MRVESAADGSALAGARVRELDAPDREPHVTGSDGTCELAVSISSQPLGLRVEKEGFFHAQAFWFRLSEVVVRLERAAELRGRVLDATSSAPVIGASVSFLHSYCKGCEEDVVVADESGSYSFAEIRIGKEVSFLLRAPDRPSLFVQLDLTDRASPSEHDFLLERGSLLEGTVADFLTDLPIPGAKVTLGVDDLTCDGSGRFRGWISSEGERNGIRVSAPGYCSLSAPVEPEEPVRLRLVEGSHIEGLVRDETGTPVPGASIMVREDVRSRILADMRRETKEPSPLGELPEGWTFENEGHFARAVADERGHFLTSGIVPWSGFLEVLASGEGVEAPPLELARVGGPGESVWLDVVVTRTKEIAYEAATVHGRVQINDEPIRSAVINWFGPNSEGGGPIYGGEYCLEDVEPGQTKLTVQPPHGWDPGTLAGVDATLDLAPGAVVEHDFDLRYRSSPISGQVLYADGAPIPAVDVMAWAPAGPRFVTTSDSEGRFELDVPAGETAYQISAVRSESVTTVVEALPGTADVRLVLPRSATLRYRVIDARTREAVPEFDIAWRGAGESEFSIEHRFDSPDTEGWLETELPSGRIDLLVRADSAGYRPTVVSDVLVSDGEETSVELELEEGLSVRLHLDESCGPLPSNCVVLLLEEQAWEQARHWTQAGGNQWDGGDFYPGRTLFHRQIRFDSAGEAALRGFAPGRLRFKVFPGDVAILPPVIELQPSDSPSVVVRWTSGE